MPKPFRRRTPLRLYECASAAASPQLPPSCNFARPVALLNASGVPSLNAMLTMGLRSAVKLTRLPSHNRDMLPITQSTSGPCALCHKGWKTGAEYNRQHLPIARLEAGRQGGGRMRDHTSVIAEPHRFSCPTADGGNVWDFAHSAGAARGLPGSAAQVVHH